MKKILYIFLVISFFLPLDFVVAGTIDSTNKYAWSNNAGWINFGSTNGNVQVTDSAITGYAWSDNYGWINMAPTNSGVVNTTAGDLSGYAWGENTGWINFDGVAINTSTGVFSGTATGDVVGTINFSCTATGCPVTTDWRPSSTVSCGDGTCNGSETCSSCPADCGGCDGGGGTITCSSNSQCGTDAYTGSLFCQDGDVYQNYITYICAVPGTANSSCTSTTSARLKTDCLEPQICSGGSCVDSGTIACSSDSDCGASGFIDSAICQNGDIYQNYITYLCANLGLVSSSCSNSVELRLKNECPESQVCENSACVEQRYTHYECQNLQCVLIEGAGINQCSANNDCIVLRRNICNDQHQCVSVDGEGSNQCQTSADCGGSAGPETHTECNNQNQCVPVYGAGQNQCQENDDCKPVTKPIEIFQDIEIIENIEAVVEETIKKIVEQPVETAKTIAKETKKIIETPQGSVVTKTVSTAGAVVTTVSVASAIIFSPFEILLMILRVSGILLTAVGIRKKIKSWGIVYDSVTKQPLDPAYVTLTDANGKVVASAITDIDGRYGFLVEPGTYQLLAKKTNYAFPSQKLAGKLSDEFYGDLYFGGDVVVTQKGEAIIKNVPMDSLKFDWNEFAKKDKKVMRFYSKFDRILRKIVDWSFIIGFFVAIVSYFVAPYPYNLVILIIYLLLLSLRFVNIKQRVYGNVLEKTTGNPLSFAVLRIIMPETNVEVAHKVADKLGRYYCLVPPGAYYVKIEKKNEDGSYSLIYTSALINVSRKGIIKNNFEV